MFSSLASLIFGTSTTKEENPNPNSLLLENKITKPPYKDIDRQPNECEEQHTIHVTSSSPSITGDATGSIIVGKRSKSAGKRNRKQQRYAHKHQPAQERQRSKAAEGKQSDKNANNAALETPATTIAQLLTAATIDDDFNEDDWFIVEKEDDELESLPCMDSEEEQELSVVEIKKPVQSDDAAATAQAQQVDFVEQVQEETALALPAANSVVVQQQRRRQLLIDAQALYNGPRHQQQRNYLQRQRNGSVRTGNIKNNSNNNNNKSVGNATKTIAKAASVERDVPLDMSNEIEDDNDIDKMTQSLFFCDNFGANSSMDESWFVTPPPCFTSIGPINMVTSPFENLLIEHPSMSVYHSIRSAQRAQESFISVQAEEETQLAETNNNNIIEVQQSQRAPNTARPRVERFTAIQLKQELFARNAQKCQERRERQNMGRGAIKRSNKVREGSNKNHIPRRSDLQHSRVLSGANNNRKICY